MGMLPVGTGTVPVPVPVPEPCHLHPKHREASTAMAKAMKEATNSMLNCMAAMNAGD